MFKLLIIDRHVMRHVMMSVLMTLLVLTALRTLFTLLDETGRLGTGNYELVDAVYYSLLLMPTRIYEFFPMAVLIGSLSALGVLASQNELTVMRAAGIKTIRILVSALKATLILMVMALIVGEWLAPISATEAQQSRANALSGGVVSRSSRGTWARSQNDIVHIQQIVDGKRLSGVTLFEFNEGALLSRVVRSSQAEFKDNQWHLVDALVTQPSAEEISQNIEMDYIWRGQLDPDHINVLTVKPEMLNLSGLMKYQTYLENNQLASERYQLEFWRKIVLPFTLIVMTVLASSFVFGPMRSVSMGARLMTGIVVGFAFHLVNQFFGPISLVYNLPPFLGAVIPMLVFACFSGYLLRRFS